MTGKTRLLFLAGSAALVLATGGIVWAFMNDYNRPYPLMDYSPQELFRYDTTYQYLQEADCRTCHGTNTAERHHNTEWAQQGQCLHCHQNYPNISPVERNCVAAGCHSWNADVIGIEGNGVWHHNSPEASTGQCIVCHDGVDQVLGPGCSLVDCPTDLNVLPSVYDCENCHWEQSVSNQSGDPANPGHPSTFHHYDEWGGFVGFYEYHLPVLSPTTALHMDSQGTVFPQCYMCHSLSGTSWDPDPGCSWDPYNLEQIRYCQRCHTKEKLHEIHVPVPPEQGWDANGWEAVGFHVPLKKTNETDLDPTDYRMFTQSELCVACHSPTQVLVEKIILKDLDSNVVTGDFKPGTNIQYKVQFAVAGVPGKQYKVVVTGKVFSLYKPDGTNREWQDMFDNPTRKKRELPERTTKQVLWDRQIPANATPDTEARVNFTLKLKEWDEGTGTWMLFGTYRAKKKFNIVP
jgi:hypothetical protein